jgi:predicted kinase
LRSDEIRKRLHGAAPEQKLPPGAYSDAATAAVFSSLAGAVGQVSGGGHSVIADATFVDPVHRRGVAVAAQTAGVPFLGIWLDAPLPVLEARIAARAGDASDATVAVLRASARSRTIPPRNWQILDATDPSLVSRADALVRAALSFSTKAVLEAQRRPAN